MQSPPPSNSSSATSEDEPEASPRAARRGDLDGELARVTLEAGAVLSQRFTIEHVAQRGGMSVVYRARDAHNGQPVAIKVMGGEAARRSERFAREAQILAELRHPGIVGYLAHGNTDAGEPYLAMDWLAGEDLGQRLRRLPLSVEESMALARSACRALIAAHRAGVVHRDIKPSNLFLEEHEPGRVKLLDFGIARGASDDERPITQNGDFLGTVGYMAPEQATGRSDVGPRADVFALGCVLYECLTACPPFESPHPVAVLAKVLREDPPPVTALCRTLRPEFDRFFARVLAKDPAQRPDDAAVFLDELEAVLAGRRAPTSERFARAEQKLVSVILGRPAGGGGHVELRTLDEGDLRYLSQNFAADVSPLQGGALLLVFPGQGEANDRAAQAAHCALALKRLRPELALSVATGLAETSGLVPVGAAIDRAAALLARGDHGARGVCIDDLTLGLVGARFDVQPGHQGHWLLGTRADLDAPRALMGRPTPYVGRDVELALLDGALTDCTDAGVARTVLVTGAPGMGKTRLASEWLSHRRGYGVRTLVARAEPATAGSTLTLVQRLVSYAAELGESEPDAHRQARLEHYLRALLPPAVFAEGHEFLAELLGLARPASPLLRAARDNPEIMREQTRRALGAWLAAELHHAPLVLVLEDLHWADAPSIAFLGEMLRRFQRAPVMLLALARPEIEQRFKELCQQASLHVRLPGLTPRASERLVRAALEPPPPDAVLRSLVRTADGNPFYLEELIRRAADGSSEWPETVLAMAQSRLEQLDPAARCVLRAASVFGANCWAEGVAEVLAPSAGEQLALDVLVERELLVRVTPPRYAGTHEYRFRHALLRDAAYSMLTSDDRVAAHRSAGTWLERVGERDARLLADHFVAGAAEARAVPWLVRAARSAIDSGDLKNTLELANQGLALGAQGEARALLLLSRAHAATWSGAPDLDGLREALEALEHGSAPWWLAVALLSLASSQAGQPERAAHYAQLAHEAPPARDHAGPYGQALFTLVGALVLLGRGELCGRLIERAQAGAEGGPDPVFDAYRSAALCALCAVAPMGGRWRLEQAYSEGLACAEQMGRLGALCGQGMLLNYVAVAATHLGRYAEARAACLHALGLAEHVGSGLNREWARAICAKAEVRLGLLREASASLTALAGSPDENLQHMLPCIAAELYMRAGDFVRARSEAERAVRGDSPRLRRMAGCLRARIALAMGELDEASRVVAEALTEQTSTGLDSEIDLHTAHAEVLLARGELAAARAAAAKTAAFVRSVADTLADPELRRSFVEDVEPCARALALARRIAE